MKGREQDSAQCPVKGPGADVPREREECPVKKVETTPPSLFGSLMSYFGGQSREDSHITSSSNPSDSSSSYGYNAAANDLVFGHQPQPDQKTVMSQKRTISSIPKVILVHVAGSVVVMVGSLIYNFCLFIERLYT